jgi:hypothetical protein
MAGDGFAGSGGGAAWAAVAPAGAGPGAAAAADLPWKRTAFWHLGQRTLNGRSGTLASSTTIR